jgi:hypothetical protein
VRAEKKTELRIHLGLFLAELICVPAFIIEIFRAIGGNELSWAYVFEWPLLGTYAIYMWRKLLREEHSDGAGTPIRPEKSDKRLDEWNQYLASVHQYEESQRNQQDT